MQKLDAAREAVITLGLLTPAAVATIASLISDSMVEHPRAITTRYRKAGEQMSDAEKKALGVRKNGFLSRAAFAEIATAGLSEPLTAHETTLLRATFTISRYRRVIDGEQMRGEIGAKLIGYEHQTLNRDCPACNRVDGKVTNAARAAILPPPDCAPGCYANYDLQMRIDWLADL